MTRWWLLMIYRGQTRWNLGTMQKILERSDNCSSVADFIAGTYSPEMIQDIRHNRQGVILIAKDGKGEDLKAQMLKLFGLYVD